MVVIKSRKSEVKVKKESCKEKNRNEVCPLQMN